MKKRSKRDYGKRLHLAEGGEVYAPTVQGYKKAVEDELRENGGVDDIPTHTYTDPDTGQRKVGKMRLSYPGGSIKRKGR